METVTSTLEINDGIPSGFVELGSRDQVIGELGASRFCDKPGWSIKWGPRVKGLEPVVVANGQEAK